VLKKAFTFFALLLVFFPPLVVSANDNDHDDQEDDSNWTISSVPPGQVRDRDYFAYGESIEISGTVNGDVYAVGGQVLVDGTINGDLLAAAGKIIISGDVVHDVRIAAGRVIVGGNIGRNLTLAGGQVEVTKTGRILGGLVGAGGDIHVAGDVQRDVVLGAANVTISNKIGGRASVAASRIRLTSQAEVAEDFRYWSENRPSMDDHAKVSGSIIKREFPKADFPSKTEILAVWAGIKLYITLASFLSSLVLGLLILHFYPKFSQRAVTRLHDQPLASVGLGVVASIVAPVFVVLLGITLFGIPLAGLFMVVFLLYLYLGRIFVIAWAGKALFEKVGKGNYEKWAFTCGLVLYALLTLIPIVGGVITALVMVVGLGTLLLAKKEVYVEAKSHGLI